MIEKRKEKMEGCKKEKKKEDSTELQKPNVEAEFYNDNKNCDCIYPYTASLLAQTVKHMPFDPWVGKIPGEGNGNPVQYPCLKNPMDRGAW